MLLKLEVQAVSLLFCYKYAQAYSKPCQKLSTIFARHFILDVCYGSEYASEYVLQ